MSGNSGPAFSEEEYISASKVQSAFTRVKRIEVRGGDVVIVSYHERDRLLTLEKIPKWFEDRQGLVNTLFAKGDRGWITLSEHMQDIAAKFCEAVKERERLGYDIPPEVREFADKHGARPDVKPVVTKERELGASDASSSKKPDDGAAKL